MQLEFNNNLGDTVTYKQNGEIKQGTITSLEYKDNKKYYIINDDRIAEEDVDTVENIKTKLTVEVQAEYDEKLATITAINESDFEVVEDVKIVEEIITK